MIDLKKCPDCYGDELCESFRSLEIQLTWFSYFSLIINQNLTKGVFYGKVNGSDVVVKRKFRRNERIQPLTKVGNWSGLNKLPSPPEGIGNVVLCSGFQDLAFLFREIEGEIDNRKLWLDLSNSIEPLLLMYFQSGKNWPVPKYHGACGDLILVEYKGESLTNFLSSKFETRASLAIHLLRMAHLFTFGHPAYSFYFTDYSLDNLVVDSGGNVFLIDLDHVIISNKSANKGNLSAEDNIHTSFIFDEVQYAFSSHDICSYHISDHNFFSVCKYLLSNSENGLLGKIPTEVEERSKVLHFLKECTIPKTVRDRFTAGRDLQSLLEKIILDYG